MLQCTIVTIGTPDGLEVVPDDDQWKKHIAARHPQLLPYRDLVIETLRQPEGIYRGKRDPTTRIYTKRYWKILIGEAPVETTNLLVFVREEDGFVVTAYFAAAMWRILGERIWPS